VRHVLPLETIGPHAEPMAAAISACVHCGFCLPACPTYLIMGEEMDSPRGRILLMKEALEGGIELEAALPHIDNCLGCLACETACPSGVRYGELLTPFRALAATRRRRDVVSRLKREVTLRVLPYPPRMRAAAWAGALVRPFAGALPAPMRSMVGLLPRRVPRRAPLPGVVPAEGPRRARVALLAGCAQQVLAPGINTATLRVLARHGVETVVPPQQGCCGSLAAHTGEFERARSLARRNVAAFPTDVDAVVTNTAGCGSGMKEYGLLFGGEADEAAARELAGRVVDVSVFLDGLGLAAPAGALARPTRVAYQDACHLAHAQRERRAPRALLGAIGNVELVEMAEAEICCGSAGVYNIERPEAAAELGARKAACLLDTGAEVIASGNVGCMTQIAAHLRALGEPRPVWHTMQVLDRASATGDRAR